jgi:hypothetical protein
MKRLINPSNLVSLVTRTIFSYTVCLAFGAEMESHPGLPSCLAASGFT